MADSADERASFPIAFDKISRTLGRLTGEFRHSFVLTETPPQDWSDETFDAALQYVLERDTSGYRFESWKPRWTYRKGRPTLLSKVFGRYSDEERRQLSEWEERVLSKTHLEPIQSLLGTTTWADGLYRLGWSYESELNYYVKTIWLQPDALIKYSYTRLSLTDFRDYQHGRRPLDGGGFLFVMLSDDIVSCSVEAINLLRTLANRDFRTINAASIEPEPTEPDATETTAKATGDELAEPAGEPGCNSPTGFLGGTAFANALGINASPKQTGKGEKKHAIPELDLKSDQWITCEVAARIYGVKPSTMADYRGGKRKRQDNVDQMGMIFQWHSDQNPKNASPWYYKPSVETAKKSKPKRKSKKR